MRVRVKVRVREGGGTTVSLRESGCVCVSRVVSGQRHHDINAQFNLSPSPRII